MNTDRHLSQFAALATGVASAVLSLAAAAQAEQPIAGRGPGQPNSWPPTRPDYTASYTSEFTHSTDSQLNRADQALGDFNAALLSIEYTVSFNTSDTYTWGVGTRWNYAEFDTLPGVPVPERGHALALSFTSQWRFADKWSLRTELRPGLYTDFEDLTGDDFNMPLTVALGYQIRSDLTLVAGLNVDLRSDQPVIGGPGVIWRFADAWRLFAVLPRPQLEYSPTSRLTLFAGGELKGITFRVAEDFGNSYGEPALNNDSVSYRELRAGGGVRWDFNRAFRFTVAGGYAWDRRFQFKRSDLLLNGDGAPYFAITLSGSY